MHRRPLPSALHHHGDAIGAVGGDAVQVREKSAPATSEGSRRRQHIHESGDRAHAEQQNIEREKCSNGRPSAHVLTDELEQRLGRGLGAGMFPSGQAELCAQLADSHLVIKQSVHDPRRKFFMLIARCGAPEGLAKYWPPALFP
jgi:hypothetical protein